MLSKVCLLLSVECFIVFNVQIAAGKGSKTNDVNARKIASDGFKITTEATQLRRQRMIPGGKRPRQTTLGFSNGDPTTPQGKVYTTMAPENNFPGLTTPRLTTVGIPETPPGQGNTMLVPENNFPEITTPRLTTVGIPETPPGQGNTMLVPENNIPEITTPRLTTVGIPETPPGQGNTMLVPENNFPEITTPRLTTVGIPETPPGQINTMMVPENNFPEITTSRFTTVGIPETPPGQGNTMLVPENNFPEITTPRLTTVGIPETPPGQINTMLVPENNFPEITTSRFTTVGIPETPPGQGNTMLVPENNFPEITTPRLTTVGIPETPPGQINTMMVPENNFLVTTDTPGFTTTSAQPQVPNVNNMVTDVVDNDHIINLPENLTPLIETVTAVSAEVVSPEVPIVMPQQPDVLNVATIPPLLEAVTERAYEVLTPELVMVTQRVEAMIANFEPELIAVTARIEELVAPEVFMVTAQEPQAMIANFDPVPVLKLVTDPPLELAELVPNFDSPALLNLATPPPPMLQMSTPQVVGLIPQEIFTIMDDPPSSNDLSEAPVTPEVAEIVPQMELKMLTTPIPNFDHMIPVFQPQEPTSPPSLPALVDQTETPVTREIAEVVPQMELMTLTSPIPMTDQMIPDFQPREATSPPLSNVEGVSISELQNAPRSADSVSGASDISAISVNSADSGISSVSGMSRTLNLDALSMSAMSSNSSSSVSEMSQLSTSSSTSTSTLSTTTVSKSGLQFHQMGSLLDTVLTDYDRRWRPRNNQARFVAIFSDFVPISIIEFNTQEQRFSVMGYFKMDWRDDFLTWTPSLYEGTETLRIPCSSIWIPKLTVDKSINGSGLVGDMSTDIALIHYRGYVRWFPEGIYSVVCTVTIRFYPFDSQNCTLTYFIADEDNSTINLKHEGEVDMSEYVENAEWKLANLSAERQQTDNIYIINYHFQVERRGGFAMFTLVVPVLLLSILSGVTFLIPIESGEKCSFSVTIFLAYGIFETVVIDTLPHNSLDVSYFIIYLTSLLIVSILLTFYTILQAKIFNTVGEKEFSLISRGSNPADPFTWGLFLQKLDSFVFVVFLILVIGFTSTFLAVMVEKFDFL